MERGFLYLVVLCLLLSYRVSSIELLANYKYWKSVSDQLTYDYSGNSRHGILNEEYIVTDRGLLPINRYYPSLMLYNNPGLADYTLSFWMLNTSSGRIWLSVWDDSNRNLLIYYYFYTSSVRVEMMIPQISGLIKTTTIGSFSGWSLHTMRVYLDSSNPGRYNFHLYRNLVHLHSNYMDSKAIPTKFTCHLSTEGYYTASSPILYELWVHIGGISSISELSSLLSIYNCPASPTTVCLPTHPRNMNKLGQLCPYECTSNNLSCDITLNCIPKNKSECQYGLYDLETSECLFYCPNNSCICPARIIDWSQSYSSFSCSCNLGYEKISDHPPACISKRCLSYSSVGYEYICGSTESGYALDAFGNCCVCRSDFTQVSLNPIICVNTSICINYTISVGDYTCSSCAKGFAIDSEGKCNKCDSKYVNVLDNPFTCIPEIDNCIRYEKEGDEWKCKECSEHYQLGISGYCDQCNPGHVKIDSENILCKREIEHCISYDLYSQESKCTVCESSYAVGPDYKCSICDEGYQLISFDPLVCEIELQHCIHYSSAEGMLKCLECETNYVFIQSECVPVPEIPFCIEYAMAEDQYVCKSCQDGYELGKNKECSLLNNYEESDLDTDNKCLELSEYCIECRLEVSDQVICLKCEYGFNLVGNICEVSKEPEELVEQATQTAEVVIAASISVSVVSLNFNSILSTIGTIQILSYIPLYNLNIPSRAKSLLEGIAIFQVIPNMFEYFVPDKDTIEIDRYKRVDVNSEVIFINAGKTLTMLILIITAIIILKLISQLTKRLKDSSMFKKIISRLLMFLEWNFAIGYFIQGTLELTIFSLINLYHVSFSNIYSTLGFITSVLILIITILSPILLLFYLLRNYEKIKANSASPKFSILYSSFKNDMVERLYFNVLEISRRLVYGVNLIVLHSSPYIQVIVNSSFSFGVLYFMIVNRPHRSKLDYYMNIYIEFVVFLILSIIVAFIYEDLATNLYYIAEWTLVVLIYCSIMIPAIVNLIISIKDLILFIKARFDRAPETQDRSVRL